MPDITPIPPPTDTPEEATSFQLGGLFKDLPTGESVPIFGIRFSSDKGDSAVYSFDADMAAGLALELISRLQELGLGVRPDDL